MRSAGGGYMRGIERELKACCHRFLLGEQKKDGLIMKCVTAPRYISESRERGDFLPKMVESVSSKIR